MNTTINQDLWYLAIQDSSGEVALTDCTTSMETMLRIGRDLAVFTQRVSLVHVTPDKRHRHFDISMSGILGDPYE